MWFCVVGVFATLVALSWSQALLGLDEGEPCKKAAGDPWKCTTLKKCAHVDVRVIRPSICSFRGREPIICCPPKTLSKAEMSCLKHTQLCSKYNMFRQAEGPTKRPNPFDWVDFGDNALAIELPTGTENSTQNMNGTTWLSSTARPEVPPTTTIHGEVASSFKPSEEVETSTISAPVNSSLGIDSSSTTISPQGRQFVVGGQLSLPRIHRHMAAIGYGQANDIRWSCGGSLVSELWILSAAHCTNSPDQGEAKWARLGELDLESSGDDARPQDRRIVRRINHPKYKPPAAYHDIALFKLDSPVVFNAYVAPVCLHTAFEIGEKKATVVGWGSTEFAGSTSSRLMEVDVSLVDPAECRKKYGKDQQAPEGIDRTAMVCAGEKEGGKDACTGDSGGPLAVNQPGSCLKKQLGITSFGRDCGLPNTPGVYTRVSTYVPWIESIVWP